MNSLLEYLWLHRNVVFTALVAWFTARVALQIAEAAGRGPVLFVVFLLVLVTYHAYQLGKRVMADDDETPTAVHNMVKFAEDKLAEHRNKQAEASEPKESVGVLGLKLLQAERELEDEKAINATLRDSITPGHITGEDHKSL